MVPEGTRDVAMGTPEKSRDSAGGAAPVSPALAVSVIIPVYNGAGTIGKCLDALLAQDFPSSDFEILVVDDGSTDATVEILKSYAQRSPRIRFLRQSNQGPAMARNVGAMHARGRVLLFTDADCEPLPDWVKEMNRPLCGPDGTVAGVKGAYRTRQTGFAPRFAQLEFEARYRRLLRSEYIDFVDTYSAGFLREAFLGLGGFDTSFPKANNEDVEFSYRMVSRGYKMVFNPAAIVYHQHPRTLYKYLSTKFGRAYWRMVVYRKFPEKMASDSYTPQSLKAQILLSLCTLALLGATLLHRRWASLTLAAAALFAVSTLPFALAALRIRNIERLFSALDRLLGPAAIGAAIRRTSRWFSRGWLAVAAHALMRVAWRIVRAAASCVRMVICSGIVQGGAKMARRLGLFAVRACVLCARAGIGLVLLVFRGLGAVLGGIRRAARAIGALPLSRGIASVMNRISTSRLVMPWLCVMMLFLRGVVMGLGVLWGLQPRRSTKRRFSQAVLLLVSDMLAVWAAGCAAYMTQVHVLDLMLSQRHVSPEAYLQATPILFLIVLPVFILAGMYRPYRGISAVNEFVVLTKANFIVAVVVMCSVFLGHVKLSRVFVLALFFFMLLFTAISRALCRALLKRAAKGTGEEEVACALIVGTGEIGQLIARRLMTMGTASTNLVGYVSKTADEVDRTIDGVPVLGTWDNLGVLIQRHGVRDVFVAVPATADDEVMHLLSRHSEFEGVSFHVVSNLFDLVSAQVRTVEEDSIPIMSLKNENAAIVHLMLKRAMDLAVASVAVLLTLPLWVFITAAIKLETPGPAMFRQERVGKNGKGFRIFKFRTMFQDTPAFALSPSTPHDSRITRVGAFLRKTSLDELPQLLNVLLGHMSLVGPRPEMPFVVQGYAEWQRERLKVKPGLTGLWQIMGRKDLPLHENLEYDFYYIKNQSLLLDMVILIKTILVVIGSKGAY